MRLFDLENKNCWRTRLLKKRITTNFILNIRKCTMLNLSRLYFGKKQTFANNYYYEFQNFGLLQSFLSKNKTVNS